jgi:hypothetical protein
MTVADDLEHGFDPLDRRAPDEDWRDLERVQQRAQFLSTLPSRIDEHADAIDTLVYQLKVWVLRGERRDEDMAPQPYPVAWARPREGAEISL